MYITVIDYSTETITKLACDAVLENTTSEDIEVILVRCGYHLSQIAYMVTEDEPECSGVVEVNDLLQMSED